MRRMRVATQGERAVSQTGRAEAVVWMGEAIGGRRISLVSKLAERVGMGEGRRDDLRSDGYGLVGADRLVWERDIQGVVWLEMFVLVFAVAVLRGGELMKRLELVDMAIIGC